jgi:hypothetical protein
MTAARSLSAEIRGAQTKTHKNISAHAVMAKKNASQQNPGNSIYIKPRLGEFLCALAAS